jgi:DNA-binding MarR family transcriptional regulator
VAETQWLTEEEQRMWRAFLYMRRDLDKAIDRQLAGVGLSDADFALLVPLSETPDHRLRARDLGSGTQWDRSRLSHHIRRMEQRGLVTRHTCETDGRGTYIQLTAEGLAAVERAAPGHVATVRRYLIDLLTPRERTVLRSISERVSAAYAESGEREQYAGDPAG